MTEQAGSTGCRLLELPPELRNMIYGHLFRNIEGEVAQQVLPTLLTWVSHPPPTEHYEMNIPQTMPNIYKSYRSQGVLKPPMSGPHGMNILQTCSHIHNEARAVLYSQVRFQGVVDARGAGLLGCLFNADATNVTCYTTTLPLIRFIDLTIPVSLVREYNTVYDDLTIFKSWVSVMRRCLLKCTSLQSLNIHMRCGLIAVRPNYDFGLDAAELIRELKKAEQEPRKIWNLLQTHVCSPGMAARLEALAQLPGKKNLILRIRMLFWNMGALDMGLEMVDVMKDGCNTPESWGHEFSINLSRVWELEALTDDAKTEN